MLYRVRAKVRVRAHELGERDGAAAVCVHLREAHRLLGRLAHVAAEAAAAHLLGKGDAGEVSPGVKNEAEQATTPELMEMWLKVAALGSDWRSSAFASQLTTNAAEKLKKKIKLLHTNMTLNLI